MTFANTKNKSMQSLRICHLAFALICSALLLCGCANKVPLLTQLEQEKNNEIILMVERDTPRYTVPSYLENPAVGGGLAVAVFGGFGVEYLQAKEIALLNKAAADQKLAANHRQNLLDALVARFREKGVTVTLVPATYEKGTLGGSRYFFKPTLADVKSLPSGKPSLYINLDMGSCTVGTINPGIFLSLNSTGVVSSPGPRQNYRGAAVGLPAVRDSVLLSDTTFGTIEEATARIAEFDAALARLIPLVIDRLMNSLQQTAP